MSHPRRRETADRVLASAGHWPLRLVLDPEPDGPPTALRTAALAWSSVAEGSTHHLVLQDDAMPAPGFFEHVGDVAAAVPDAAVAFFTSWSSRNGAAVRLGALLGTSWVRATGEFTPTVALLLPAEVARGFAGYAAVHGAGWPDDVIMRRYLRSRGVPCYLTVPNLVEHDDGPSVAGNDGHGLRRAACFPGEPVASDRDVTNGRLEPPVVPFFKHGASFCAVRTGEDDWMTYDAERYARRLGFDTAAFRSRLAAGDGPAPVRRAALDALGLTAGLVGFLYGEPAGSLAAAAMGTMAPGGLCDELDVTADPALRRRLDHLVGEAMRVGATQPRSFPRPPARSRVVLAGSRRDVSARLADDLAGHGYRVVVAGDPGENLRGGDAVVVTGPDGSGIGRRAAELGIGHVVRIELGPDAAAGPAETVLRAGTPYGPGIDEPLTNELVTSALTRRAIRLPQPPPGPVRYVHIDDLCRAVERALAARQPGVHDIRTGPLVGPYELAEAVCAAVRRVPIVPAAAPGTRPPAAGPDPDRSPGMPLGAGLRTLAQWLAYEADHRPFDEPVAKEKEEVTPW